LDKGLHAFHEEPDLQLNAFLKIWVAHAGRLPVQIIACNRPPERLPFLKIGHAGRLPSQIFVCNWPPEQLLAGLFE
jgi:hypothetical protein